MKIHIDTKEDSPEELRKVIRFLSHIVGDDYKSNSEIVRNDNVFSDNSPAIGLEGSGSVFGAMFDNDSGSSETETYGDDDSDDENEDIEEADDDIQIIAY